MSSLFQNKTKPYGNIRKDGDGKVSTITTVLYFSGNRSLRCAAAKSIVNAWSLVAIEMYPNE